MQKESQDWKPNPCLPPQPLVIWVLKGCRRSEGLKHAVKEKIPKGLVISWM